MREFRRILRRGAFDLAAACWSGPCPVCLSPLPGRALRGICPACWCGLTRAETTDGETPRAAFTYRGGIVKIHRRLKFSAEKYLASPLARRMALVWKASGGFHPDLIVPVPADPLRLSYRRAVPGWLADSLARHLECVAKRNALRKIRPTRTQTKRSARERRTALVGLFRAKPRVVAGKNVLIVDDITTTGATLREAARAVQEAGALHVDTFALAHTPPA